MAPTEFEQPRQFAHVLSDLKSAMEAAGGQYAVIGGVAVVLSGYLRNTVDLDAIAVFDFTRIDEFAATLQQHGFELGIPDAVAFARRNYVLKLVHHETGVPVDIAFAFTPFEQEAIAKSRLVNLETGSYAVASPEDLLIMKCVAHRPIDEIDIREIYQLHADQIDLQRVRYWVEQFAEALEEPDLWAKVEPLLQKE